MKTDKIVKQIRREAKSHPAKAIVLSVLAVVAVCYWASLAWSWGDDEKGKSIKTSGSDSSVAEATPQQNLDPEAILAAELAKIKSANQAENNARHGWKQIVEWIEKDPRTLAVEKMPGRADAFETADEPQVQEQVKEDDSKTQSKPIIVVPDVTPRQLEMSLSSTLLGPDGGVALIDGKAYRIGQTVTSEKDQHQTPFVLSEVHARHVMLTHKDKKHKLLLPEKKRTGNIQISIKNK